ncbi:MAG: YceH family protein [bacterium]
MDIILTPLEVRILGSLIEKEITTPDYYPLTLNALTNACNQKSNRNPVMTLDEKTVVRVLDDLRQKHLVWLKNTAEGRVPKYAHRIGELFEFSPAEIGILCVLMLRGYQTSGELHSRTNRMYEFKDLSEVEATLQYLMEREEGPFVVKLPRLPGRKESRYAHLFCGEVKVDEKDLTPPPEAARIEVLAEDQRISALEEEVRSLRAEMEALKERFIKFAQEFE